MRSGGVGVSHWSHFWRFGAGGYKRECYSRRGEWLMKEVLGGIWGAEGGLIGDRYVCVGEVPSRKKKKGPGVGKPF